MDIKVVLISGLHPNERCAPAVTAEICTLCRGRGLQATHFEVPYAYTLLANLDDPDNADPKYCMPRSNGPIDVDLSGLVGDEALQRRFPGHVVFEFHNSRDVWKKFGIPHGKPVEQFEIGPIMPRFTRPYEIGTWRNVLPDGTRGKYVIELPAVTMPVSSDRVCRRLSRLEELRTRGYFVDEKVIACYLTDEADIEATRARRLMDPCIVQKVGDWMLAQLRGSEISEREMGSGPHS